LASEVASHCASKKIKKKTAASSYPNPRSGRAYLGQGHANFQKGDIMMPTQEHMMTLSLLWHKRMIMLTCALGPYTQGQSRYLTVLFEVRERWPVCHWAI